MGTTSKMAVTRPMLGAVLLLVVTGMERAGRGELVTPAQRELVKAERKLEAARGRVTVTTEQLSTAQSLRMARLSVFRACQAAHDAALRVRNQAEQAEALARGEAVEAEQLAHEAAQVLDRNRRAMEPARDRFLDRPLIAYDVKQQGTLTFNMLTSAFDMTLDQGPGITLTDNQRDALLAGQFTLPEIDPLQLAADTMATRTRLLSNYAEVRASLTAEHGASRVYLLSRRFLEWATPDRIAGDFARASLTSGISLADELALARRQIQLEYEDLAAWLRLKGVKDLGPEPASIVVDLIRTGACPRLSLAVKTRPVAFVHRLEPAGQTEVPADYLERLRSKRLPTEPAAGKIADKRPALAIIWTGPASAPEPLPSHLESDFRLSPPAINDLTKLLPPQTDPRIRRLLGDLAQHGLLEIDASSPSRRLAQRAIGLRKEDIERPADANRTTINLRSSDFGEIVAAFVSQLALGNKKTCDIEVLELDRATGRLEGEFTLHHRHAWPSLREAQVDLKRALGPVGTEVEDLADHLPDATFDIARKLYHEADKNAHELGKQAYEAEQRAHEAADRVATKGQELATLAGELARAQIELRAATEREALARQDAQAACALMLELDAQVRLARNRAHGQDRWSPAKPLVYDSRDASKKW